MKISLLAVALMFATFASLANAADPPTTAPSRFVLTIYNPPEDQSQPYYYDEHPNADRTADGFAVVREVRPIDLLAGDNMVRFTDVATGIDPTTVAFKSLTAPDSTAVLEQNYEYDLVSGDKLLQKYLGKAVTVHAGHQGANAAAPSVIQGDLLSFDENSLVIQTNGSVEVVSAIRGDAGQPRRHGCQSHGQADARLENSRRAGRKASGASDLPDRQHRLAC